MEGWRGHALAAFVGIIFTGAVAGMLFVWRDFPLVAQQGQRNAELSAKIAVALEGVAISQTKTATQLDIMERRMQRVENRMDSARGER